MSHEQKLGTPSVAGHGVTSGLSTRAEAAACSNTMQKKERGEILPQEVSAHPLVGHLLNSSCKSIKATSERHMKQHPSSAHKRKKPCEGGMQVVLEQAIQN